MEKETTGNKFRKAAGTALISLSMTIASALTAFAEDATEAVGSGKSPSPASGVANFLTDGSATGRGANAFDSLTNTTKAVGASAVSWVITLGIVAAAVYAVVAGIKLMRGGKSTEEAKGRIICIVGAVVLIGGIVGLINMAFGIGASAF